MCCRGCLAVHGVCNDAYDRWSLYRGACQRLLGANAWQVYFLVLRHIHIGFFIAYFSGIAGECCRVLRVTGAAVVVVALLVTSCSNPGIAETVDEMCDTHTRHILSFDCSPEGESGWVWNAQADGYRPPGAQWCEISQVTFHKYAFFVLQGLI